MTGREILEAASSFVDEGIDEADGLYAINSAIAEIGDMALIYDNITITTKGDRWEFVADDLLNIVEIEDNHGNLIQNYRERNGQVKFVYPGRYNIWYRRLPRPIESLDDTPELHTAYHPCLVTYLAYWFKKKDDDENPDANFLYEKFTVDVRRVFSQINRKRTPVKVRVVR